MLCNVNGNCASNSRQTECYPEIITALDDETRRLVDAPDSEEVAVSEGSSEERPSVF